ncbi:MAG: SEL1-like repeat protein [Lentisphaeria bacterium]|nr:SEL1-like repeat protein [Lentisphaeria bacterium]
MKLKESFDNCMAMLGCLSVLVIFFSFGGYVCHTLLLENTVGIWGYLIGGVLLVILPMIAVIVLVGFLHLGKDAWEARKNHKENDDSTPQEESARTVDPYEAAVLPQPQPEPEVDGGENAPERRGDNRTRSGIPLKYSVLGGLFVLACTVLLLYDGSRSEKLIEETRTAIICSEGMTAYIAKDYDAAMTKFRKAAGKGNARAKYMLGVCCYDGTGADEDWDAAFRWFYEAGKQDDPDALYRLGLCCEQAIGTERDMERALFCWGKAAKLGHAEAQRRAGETAITVFGEFDDGIELLRKSAAQGNPFAMRFLGFVYAGKDKAESDDWYRKAAEALYRAAKQGDPRAQHDLAGLYRDGIGVSKDPAEADKWFALAAKNYCAAAERGDPEAQCMLGGFYMKGVGVEKDEAEAVKWFRKAAEQGFMKGKALLGLAYFEGNGVKKDEAEGVRWLRVAAEQGDPDAQLFLDSHGE